MATTVRAKSGRAREEPAASSGLPCRRLDHFLLLSQAYYSGAGSLKEQPRLELAPIWDADTTDGGLTHCATALAPSHKFFNSESE